MGGHSRNLSNSPCYSTHSQHILSSACQLPLSNSTDPFHFWSAPDTPSTLSSFILHKVMIIHSHSLCCYIYTKTLTYFHYCLHPFSKYRMHVLCNAFTLKSRINRKLKHLTKEYELSSCKRLIKAVCKTGACGGYRVKQEYDSVIYRDYMRLVRLDVKVSVN